MHNDRTVQESSVDVRKLVDDRIIMREKQLMEEIRSEFEKKRTHATRGLTRRIDDLAKLLEEDPERIIELSEHVSKRIQTSLDAFRALEERIMSLTDSSTSIGQIDSTRASDKVTEFQHHLRRFLAASLQATKAKLQEDSRKVDDIAARSVWERCRMTLEVSKSDDFMKDPIQKPPQDEPACEIDVKFSGLVNEDILISIKELGVQISVLKSSLRKLSYSKVAVVGERTAERYDEEYLGIIADISARMFDLKRGGLPIGSTDMMLVKTALSLVLNRNTDLVTAVLERLDDFIENGPTDTKVMKRFLDQFSRRVIRDRFR
jgi:hypothetical protein